MVHPVAVLPLARGPLSLLVLVSGALAPDVPYYLRAVRLPVTAESWYEPYVNATGSHSLPGLLSVSLPLALALYVCGSMARSPFRWVACSPILAGTRSPRAAVPNREFSSTAALCWVR